MRHLLNTLFVLSENAYLRLEDENIVILKGEENAGKFPLRTFEAILSFSNRGASPALMGACAQNGINLCFLTPFGKFLAQVCGEMKGNVLLRKEQYRISDSPERSCGIARNMVFAKIFNCRWILERMLRDHGLSIDAEKIRKASGFLCESFKKARAADSLERLRGIEGEAASCYFGVFSDLILQNKKDFFFSSRSRRPPLDPVNAALSFAYTLLAADCAAALSAAGLDPYVGFLHRDRPGRASLALDLMEEMRGVIADRFVLSLINNRLINRNSFVKKENGAVFLNDEGKKVVLSEWQKRKKDEIMHPFLQEKLPWGLVPYVQALLLARTIRGDLDEYLPLLWK